MYICFWAKVLIDQPQSTLHMILMCFDLTVPTVPIGFMWLIGPKSGLKGNFAGARFTNFFARNSDSMETSPYHNSIAGHPIATKFCTCHDSTAVVPCTQFCSNHCIRIEVRVKRNFHLIWIAMEKWLVKRAPGYRSWGSTLLMIDCLCNDFSKENPSLCEIMQTNLGSAG